MNVQADDVRRKTLTFHPSLQPLNRNTREIVMPAQSFDDDSAQDFSNTQPLPEKFELEGGRMKRQASSLPQGAVRGVLPSLPANSTSVVS